MVEWRDVYRQNCQSNFLRNNYEEESHRSCGNVLTRWNSDCGLADDEGDIMTFTGLEGVIYTFRYADADGSDGESDLTVRTKRPNKKQARSAELLTGPGKRLVSCIYE